MSPVVTTSLSKSLIEGRKRRPIHPQKRSKTYVKPLKRFQNQRNVQLNAEKRPMGLGSARKTPHSATHCRWGDQVLYCPVHAE